MPIVNNATVQITIRYKTLQNTIKNLIGIGNKVIRQYELIGAEKYTDRIQRNKQLMNSIIRNDLTIEIMSQPNPAILFKPFRGIESVRKGEEYFEILYGLYKEFFNRF